MTGGGDGDGGGGGDDDVDRVRGLQLMGPHEQAVPRRPRKRGEEHPSCAIPWD